LLLNNLACAKFVVENLDFRTGTPAEQEHDEISATTGWTDCGKARSLAKSFKKITYQAVEIRVLFAKIFDLPDGVDNGRVVLASKTPPDLRQG